MTAAASRTVSIPPIEYPAELPITAHRQSLLRLVAEHRVIIVCGETGSGKSTQLPKILLESGLGRRGMIGHTQPRRLAARSIAARIAEELDTTGDSRVGYKIRFGDQTSPETLIKLMTDGILLAETQSDRDLRAYDALIIDEAHERSLNIDFLLGYLLRVIERRPEFRLIITSATIDAERFAEHFSIQGQPAPIVMVEGRGFPVDIRYLSWTDVNRDAEDEDDNYDLGQHVIAGIDNVCRAGGGDVLVFLPTERDIREVSHQTAGHFKRLGLTTRVDVLPLYARLPQAEQQRIFHPTGDRRRIVFATNVAESSLTVPGIRYVVDAGTARISRYSPRSRVQRLPIEAVSRASCDQRAGRCGRVAPGVCVRLYSQQDYENREAFTTPEIRRTNLASVILQTLTLRLGSIDQFPLIDPPRPDAVRQGYRTLRELGAVDDHDQLTDIGRRLGRMPVDPRVGRMILAADEFGVLPEVLVIAAAIEVQDPRERPQDKRQAADEAHEKFQHPRSDFLSFLMLWRFYQQQREAVSHSKLDRICRGNFLSPQRMREWCDVYRQLREMVVEAPPWVSGQPASPGQASSPGRSKRRQVGAPRFSESEDEVIDAGRYTTIHQALLTGLLSGVAHAGDKHEYTGAGGLKLFLWPGSGVFAAKPKWIVASELVETTRQYARTVAAVQPEWIEPLAEHLVKKSYSDPHWSNKSGGAFCYQQVSLFGLPIVTRRRLSLSPLDPATARELMIDEGLANDAMPTTARSVRFNRQLVAMITELAAKTRRREYVIDPYNIRNFYASRLPDFVCDRVRLEKYDKETQPPAWTKTLTDAVAVADWLQSPPLPDNSAGFPSAYMRPDDLVPVIAQPIAPDAFPDELVVGQTRLPLAYRFEPGGEQDGVSVTVHQSALAQVSDDRLGWLVPGLLEAKLTAMIKSLPKRIRRNLVPAADVARRVAAELAPKYGEVPFMPAVCDAFSRVAEMRVTPDDFTEDKLEPHLDFLVQVVDDDGKTIAKTRSIDQAKRQVGVAPVEVAESSDAADQSWSRSEMTTFDIEELPPQVVRMRGGVRVAQFPGLVDCGKHAQTRLFADEAAAVAATRGGLMRLFSIAERKELRGQVRHFPGLGDAKVRLAPILAAAIFEDAWVDLLARRAFVEGSAIVRSRVAFEAVRGERGRRIGEAACEVAPWLPAFADAYHAARRSWESFGADRTGAVVDIKRQVAFLTQPGFLCATPWQWLKQYPRYFQGIAYRLDKLKSGASRDADSMHGVNDLWNRWLQTLSVTETNPAAIGNSIADYEIRWMLEELRVSLFAQPLGTSVKVSPQRCEKMISG